LKIGDVTEFNSFASAVIDDKAFNRIVGYIEHAKKSPNLKIIGGGEYDKRYLKLIITIKIILFLCNIILI